MVSYMTCNSDLKRRGIFQAGCWDLQRVALGWLAAVRDLVDHVCMALIGRFDQEGTVISPMGSFAAAEHFT